MEEYKVNVSYDYSELIRELEDELYESILTEDSYIYVLRSEPEEGQISFPHLGIEPQTYVYAPIIDWFYGDEEEVDYDPWDEEDGYILEQLLARKQEYLDAKDKLEKMKIGQVLEYMNERSRIINGLD